MYTHLKRVQNNESKNQTGRGQYPLTSTFKYSVGGRPDKHPVYFQTQVASRWI